MFEYRDKYYFIFAKKKKKKKLEEGKEKKLQEFKHCWNKLKLLGCINWVVGLFD